ENSKRLDAEFLRTLAENGNVVPEAVMIIEKLSSNNPGIDSNSTQKKPLFSKSQIKRSAPKIKVSATKKVEHKVQLDTHVSESTSKGFVMTLQKTDVGTGQTTEGTSRRSPEIFIPLSARDFAPDFWGWKDSFTEDPKRLGKFDRL